MALVPRRPVGMCDCSTGSEPSSIFGRAGGARRAPRAGRAMYGEEAREAAAERSSPCLFGDCFSSGSSNNNIHAAAEFTLQCLKQEGQDPPTWRTAAAAGLNSSESPTLSRQTRLCWSSCSRRRQDPQSCSSEAET